MKVDNSDSQKRNKRSIIGAIFHSYSFCTVNSIFGFSLPVAVM